MKVNVEFGEMTELDTVGGETRVMYCSNCQAEGSDGKWYSFDYVPLTGAVSWDYSDYSELPNDLWFGEDDIRLQAFREDIKAYYIGPDGKPFIASERIDPYGMQYYSFFNEVEAYFSDDMSRLLQFDYIGRSEPVSHRDYLDAMMRRYI